MYIIIGFLTTIAGLIWALHALQNAGFDLNSLNPFYYARRRKWQNTYGARPILNLAQQIPNIVKRSKENVNEEQYVSILSLMNKAGNLEGGLVADQIAMVETFSNQYDFERVTNAKWNN